MNKDMTKQITLFKEPPLRRKNGKYCTKEQFRQDKVDEENKKLQFEKEKYKRAWLAVLQENIRLKDELKTLKRKIGGLVEYGRL